MTTYCNEKSRESHSGYAPMARWRAIQLKQKRQSVVIPHGLVRECLNALRSKARLAVVIGKLWELKAISKELFDSVQVEFEVDPEVQDSCFLVFNVTAKGEIKEIADRRKEWHRRTHGFLGSDFGLVRLMIDVQ